MITTNIIKTLRINNYVRKASHNNNYWVDFSKSKLDDYLLKYKNINIIIYSKLNSSKHYYIIPYVVLKNIFKKKYFTKDKKKRKRWIATIQDDKIKFSNYNKSIDIKKYYANTIKGYNTNLLDIAKQDINSLNDENKSNFEGSKKRKLTSYYERKPQLRAQAIQIHGTKCIICKFDFLKTYGEHGKNFIEVHHIIPLYTKIKASLINPAKDMTVLCPNCHRMIHRKRNNPLTIERLKKLWKKRK